MEIILEGKVLWSYQEELSDAGLLQEVNALFSFSQPLHHHAGEIALTENEIIISGVDEELRINLAQLDQIYMGFDEIFKSTYVKNAGMFWQPLRLGYHTSTSTNTVYLIIDHNILGSQNKLWFQTLTGLFSEEIE